MLKWILKPLDDYMKGKTVSSTPNVSLSQTAPVIAKKHLGNGYRPITFDNYIGQDKAKKLLKAYIEQAKLRKITLPHLLISGPTGVGKTTLARIVANELNVKFYGIIAASLNDGIDTSIFEESANGFLFLDEIHALKREFCEALYPVMEDFKISEDEPVEPFTLVGATTELGEIKENKRPFYDRFMLKVELEDYTESNIRLIVKQYCEKLFPSDKLDSKAFDLIARNSRLSPRQAISLLTASIYLGKNVKKALDSLNIIGKGLTIKDLQILELIAKNKGAIGEQAICSYISTSRKNYRFDYEPYLLKNNFLMRTDKGRTITDKGMKVISYLKQAQRRAT